MSQEDAATAEAQAVLDARTHQDRKMVLDWSEPATWMIYGFGAVGLILLSFLVFGFLFIRVIPFLVDYF